MYCMYWDLQLLMNQRGEATVLVIVEIQFNVYYIEVPSLKIVYGVKHVNHNALIIEYTDNQTFSLSSSL